MIICKYDTENKMRQIIVDKQAQGFTLIEVQNITEGNFLGFLEPNEPLPAPQPDRLQLLQAQIDDLTIAMAALMGGAV